MDGRPKLRPAGPGQMDQRTVLHWPVARRNIHHDVPKLLVKRWIYLTAGLRTFKFNADQRRLNWGPFDLQVRIELTTPGLHRYSCNPIHYAFNVN